MTKLPAANREPITATERDVEKADAIKALLVSPIGILPSTSGDPILPFAIGLFDEIRLLLKPEVNVTALRRAVGAFVHSKRYYFASAQPDSMRHTIDGIAVEPVSDVDRLAARQRLTEQKRSDAKVAEPAPAAPAAPPAVSKAELIRASLLNRNRQAGSTAR